ncbi:MAG: hydantoinase B/oxoprolinase family protein [Bacillota bacterium]
MSIDPVTLEVMRNAFQSVAEEMGAALIRTALSTNIKDRRDCSTAIYTPEGSLVAQAEHIPLHLGLMPTVVKEVLRRHPPERLGPGDAVIINDPYISGSHLPDICMITPVYKEGTLVALLANLAHHVDIGGISPGGMPASSSEIFQEGLRIPPIKLREGGEVKEEILNLISSNVRTSQETRGDFQAQMAANNVGERRVLEIVDRYGASQVLRYMEEIINYSERRMLAMLEQLPRGTYRFEDYLEGDGFSDDLIPIKVAVTIEGGNVHVDFTGTSPQVKGSVNCTRAVTLASVYYAIKCVADPDLPSSEGSYKPVKVTTPEGTLVNPRFPAAVSNANINTAQRIADVVLGALALAVPERVTAASTGSMSLFTIGGLVPGTNTYFSYVETYGGGQGALWDQDGMDGVHTNMTNTRNAPTEVIEMTYPLRVERYGLVPDSEGPGAFRGGLGLTREIVVLGEETGITLSTERRKTRPWGLQGGKPGEGSECWLVQGRERILPTKITTTVSSGSKLILKTAGGGGYGDPLRRDPKSVLWDVREGLISSERARERYGVAVNTETWTVMEEETARLRTKSSHPMNDGARPGPMI